MQNEKAGRERHARWWPEFHDFLHGKSTSLRTTADVSVALIDNAFVVGATFGIATSSTAVLAGAIAAAAAPKHDLCNLLRDV